MAKMFAVSSGKGGVGKSMIALSLAISAAKQGRKTILLDASGVSRSCDLALGMESVVVLDLADVCCQQTSLESTLYKVPRYENLSFACASLYDDIPIGELNSILLALHSLCDVVVIDFPTGETAWTDGMLNENDCRLIVTTPDDASIRASERLMMRTTGGREQRWLIVNRSVPAYVRKDIQYDAKTVEMTLDCMLAGCVPEDDSIAFAALKGRSAIESGGPAQQALHQLMDTLLGDIE